MNSIAEIKSALHQHISSTNDLKILAKFQEYVKGLLDEQDEVVAFNSDGTALTRKAYKEQIDSLILDADNGDLIDQAEIESNLDES